MTSLRCVLRLLGLFFMDIRYVFVLVFLLLTRIYSDSWPVEFRSFLIG